MRTMPTTYMRVRAPAPPLGASRTVAGGGDQLFRAIQRDGLPRSFWGRYSGHAPWAAFTLSGSPDEPIDVGFVVASRSAKQRDDMAMAIRTVIQGQSPGAQVETHRDPLAAALELGDAPRAVGSCDYVLKLPAHYPLRAAEDVVGSDLLGPLAAALAPHGTLRTEAQIIVRPASAWALTSGWRGRATALLLTLQAREDYALADDARAIEAKLEAAPFEAWVRVVVVTEGEQARTQVRDALDQIGAVLGQYAERTSSALQHLVAYRTRLDSIPARDAAASSRAIQRRCALLLARAPRPTPLFALALPIRLWRDPDILASNELAGLYHLPTPALARLVRWLPCRFLPADPHAYTQGRTDRIVVGHARRADGTVAAVGPTLRDLRQILHLTAGMGAGKSRLLANICKQLIPHGLLLLDGKGDDRAGNLAATMRRHLPLADEGRLVILDILDTDWPFWLNPMAGIDLARPGGADQGLAQLLAVFARLDPETWGKSQGMQQYARMSALLVLETVAHPTLAHVKQALVDERYRERLLPGCTNPDVATFWRDIYPKTGEQQKQSRDALLRRLDALLATETTRYMVTQPSPTLSLLDAIEQGLIVLVPMPEMTLGDLAGTIGMIVFQAVVRAALSRDGDDQSRATYALIIDELQVFAGTGDTRDVRKAITQLRSLGIAGVYAHQSLTQLGDLQDEMLTNAFSRIILKTQEPDASTYARHYAASGLTAADIAGQDPNEHQYAVLLCDGRPTGLFSMQTLPWPDVEQVEIAPYAGEPWQTIVPADSHMHALDRRIAGIVYGEHADWQAVVAALAALGDDDWARLLARWEAIRACQRVHILAHPGCIPDRLERQRWLSRLRAATPRILAAAEYARIRRAIEPGGIATPGIRVVGEDGKPLEGRRAADTVQIAATAMAGAIEDGTRPPALHIPPAPAVAERVTLDDIRQQRGYRRSRDDIADGFDDLPDDR